MGWILCSLVKKSTHKNLRSHEKLDKRQIIHVIKKKLALKKNPSNLFYVIVKRTESNEKLKEWVLRALEFNFKISSRDDISINLEKLINKKAKIVFETT